MQSADAPLTCSFARRDDQPCQNRPAPESDRCHRHRSVADPPFYAAFLAPDEAEVYLRALSQRGLEQEIALLRAKLGLSLASSVRLDDLVKAIGTLTRAVATDRHAGQSDRHVRDQALKAVLDTLDARRADDHADEDDDA